MFSAIGIRREFFGNRKKFGQAHISLGETVGGNWWSAKIGGTDEEMVTARVTVTVPAEASFAPPEASFAPAEA